MDRLLPELEKRLKAKGRGARRLRFQLFRADSTMQTLEIGMARPSASPDRIKPLLLMKLPDVEAEFGIDCLRLEAHVTEPVHAQQHRGHLDAASDARHRLTTNTGIDDLIGRVGRAHRARADHTAASGGQQHPREDVKAARCRLVRACDG